MDKGNFRRERLSELGIERLQRPTDSSWSNRSRRFQDRWHRFSAGGFERTFFALACAVAVVVGLIGVVALATQGGGGDGSAPASAQARPTGEKPANGSRPSPTAITIGVPDIPTNFPTETEVPEATPENDRMDCDEIRGTAYRSNEERAWYEKNCTASVNAPTARPPGSIGNTPVPQPTAPQPTAPPAGLTTGEAIGIGAQWLRTSAAKAYNVDSGSCSAVHIGDHWIVSCTGRLAGCQSASCERDLQVCVYADRRVVPASNC